MLLSFRQLCFTIILTICAMTALTNGFAQIAQAPASAPAPTSLPEAGSIQWKDLSAAQKSALAPLSQQWASIPEVGQRKWLRISRNFDQLTEEEKELVQGRIRAWAALTPQDRSRARLNYADAKQLSQDEKHAKWEAYQSLSEEDKLKLAQQRLKPAAKSTALALRPVDSEKLPTLPINEDTHRLPRIDIHHLNPVTLLPTNAHVAPVSHP